MKIGIYGGTFDPPHLGHMSAASAAIATLGLDRLIFMPAKQPPHKQLPSDSATPQQRLEMVSQMADGMLMPGRVQVSAMELERTGKSYTVDSLLTLKKRQKGDELWLLMGADMFLTLQSWHRADEIMTLANIAAFARTESDSGEMMEIQGSI